MRTLSRGALLAILLLPALGQAALARAQLDTFERQLWRISTDHHMLDLMDGDQRYSASLGETAAAAAAGLETLAGNAESEQEQALVADLQAQWNALDVTGEGDPARFDRVPTAVSERLRAFEGGESGDYDDVQRLIAELHRLTARYTAIVAGGDGDGDQDAFRAELGEFAQELRRVQAAHGDHAPLQEALEQSRLKWEFVRGSLTKFGDDAVPFLVYRYTGRMTDNLDQAMAPAD